MKNGRVSDGSPVARPSSPRHNTIKRTGIFVFFAFCLLFLFHLTHGPLGRGYRRGASPNEHTTERDGGRGWQRKKIHPQWERRCLDVRKVKGRRVLVTGSAGFIGYHTAVALQSMGDAVIGLDNFNNYYPVVLKRERAKDLESMGVYTVDGELKDQELLQDIMDSCSITHVVHLAAQAGVRYAKEHPMQYVESNVHGSVTVFEAARHALVPPAIIYASSSSVYGSNTRVPFSEEDAVDQPSSLYGATKRSVELTAVVYHRLFSLSMTGLRFFTVYGPYGRPDMACFQFARAIAKQEPIQIFMTEDGKEFGRDFTYIDDVVRGIVGAMDTAPPSTEEASSNRLFNLGNTSPVTVTKFVQALELAMGQETTKECITIRNTGDVLFTHANVTNANKVFNFTPAVSLDEGMLRFARWFNNYSQTMPNELWTYTSA